MLKITNLQKTFNPGTVNAKTALNGLNLTLNEGDFVYFVHSYLIQPENPEVILATADYGVKVPSAIKSKNIYAFQFHPEKSGEWGLKLLQNFINL